MDSTDRLKPKTIAEMLPGLDGLLSPSAMKDIRSAVKNPRKTLADNITTTSKKLKPMTFAEMFAHFPAFESSLKSPGKNVQMSASSKKKWNTSTKMANKTVSHTLTVPMKHHSVRKVLNFQPSKVVKSFSNSRATMMNAETPKFPKPKAKAMKPLSQLAGNNVRISGICNIPESPVLINKTVKSTMTTANKENFIKSPVVLLSTPKQTLRKKVLASMIPDTPLLNESMKSSSDDSFLQNERDIHDIENQMKPLTEMTLTDEKTLENIAEVSPPVSTPFMEYRNVGDYFNNTLNQMENTTENTYLDNTIMSLDKTVCKDNSKRDESMMVPLCEMLNKATLTSDEQSTELESLLQAQKQIENSLEILETGISSLIMLKESQLNSLAHIKNLIHKTINKTETEKVSLKNNNMPNESTPKNKNKVTSSSDSVKNINCKQFAYKIPKKTPCSKKKVIFKNQSMPNLPRSMSPKKPLGDRALSIYMQMKERNKYLTTPNVKRQPQASMVPNTPALISLNLQQQLDRLYGNS